MMVERLLLGIKTTVRKHGNHRLLDLREFSVRELREKMMVETLREEAQGNCKSTDGQAAPMLRLRDPGRWRNSLYW